jgi:hypothetical protein
MQQLEKIKTLLPLFVVAAIVCYFALTLAGNTDAATVFIFAALVAGTVPLVYWI